MQKIYPCNIQEHDEIDNFFRDDRRILYQPIGKAEAYTVNEKKRYR
jgi:hypothetical protein